MKRHYKPVHARRSVIFSIAIPVIVILLLIGTPLFSWLLGPSHVLARPFWWVSQTLSASARTTTALAHSKKSLIAELNTAREALAGTSAVEAENRYLKNENAELQTLLNATPEPDTVVAARVLVRPPQTWYDALIIDKGTEHGIAVGDKVYAYGTIVLGTVVEASAQTSTIELYSASNRITDALIVPGNTPVQVMGTGNSGFRFEIHRDLALDENATIVSPDGELLGTVKSIQFDTRDPYRQVRAVSAVNLQYIRFVTVRI